MTTKHKLVTGAVAVASVAALYTAATPVSAASHDAKGTTTVSVKSEGVTAKGACNSWKNAVGIPGKWSKSKYGCAIFGKPGLKVTYRWAAERGAPCIKVKGFVKGGPKGFKTKWYNAGCGKTGFIKNVPWGNVAADREIQIRGASLLKWR
jgi:hypothetical protein